MGRFFNAVKAGVASMKESAAPAEYTIAGKVVHCPHCSHPSATILVCAECGRIEWFAQEPDRS